MPAVPVISTDHEMGASLMKYVPASVTNPSAAVSLVAAALGLATLAGPALAQSQEEQRYVLDRVYFDEPRPDGTLTGGVTQILVPADRSLLPTYPAESELVWPSGDPANRIDLVFVGDGYTADEMTLYADEVDVLALEYFNEEPFITYAPYYNVHRVDVISAESGVDNDPTFGIYRNTALDMEFWCGGTERLLCVNVSKAYSYANNAPDVDLVAAIANSSKYGGGGYSGSDLGTTSSRNALSTEVILHEFGHALGNLADEYDYDGGTYYNGWEPSEPNVSTLIESEMAQQGKKWAAWLGENDPLYDGLVSTYEGAKYYQYGIYRPTYNSMMRSLNRPFNLPSIEAILIEMYKVIDPIDDSADTNITYNGTETVWVLPMQPIGHSLDIQWFLNDEPIPGATGTDLDLSTLDFSPGQHLVHALVVDNTWWVRDESARNQYMSRTRAFHVETPTCLDLRVDNLVADQDAVFTVAEGIPGREVAILWSRTSGNHAINKGNWCAQFQLNLPTGLETTRLVALGTFDNAGQFSAIAHVPASAQGVGVHFQAAMADTCPDSCMSNVWQGVVE